MLLVGDKGATLLLLLFLCSGLVVPPSIGMAEANGAIYIRADGSVEGTDKIQRDGDVYTFTVDIYEPLVVEKDNIVVDGAGYSIEGQHTALAQSPEGIGILLEGRRDVTIRNIAIQNFLYGICINSSSKNRITNGNFTNNTHGIYLEKSYSNIIRQSQITHNTDLGIYVFESSDTTIRNNTIGDNANDGISLVLSSDNDVSYCQIRDNGIGIRVMNSSVTPLIGVNDITHNSIGIHLAAYSIHIQGNNIAYNGIGIQLAGSNNIVDRNNFINNTKQVYDIAADTLGMALSVNTWDHGDTGNYWSDYTGKGDTPYIIDENNQDNFPVMEPFTIPPDLCLDADDIVLPTSNIFWSITIIAVVGAVLLFYFRRTKNKKHSPKNAEDNPVNEANSAFMQPQ